MKKLLPLLPLSLALLGFGTARSGHQYIQCASWDTDATERVVVSLKPDRTGTLFLISSIEEEENSGIIPLAFDVDTGVPQHLGFHGQNTATDFWVLLPEKNFWARSDDFSMDLRMRRKDGSYVFSDELRCYSRLYEE
jgi:hypothetical protein